jgi:hypothetical protein
MIFIESHYEGPLRRPVLSLSTWRPSKQTFKFYSKRVVLLGLFSCLVGFLDDLQVRFFHIGRLGNGAEIVYQAVFLLVAAAIAYVVLRRRGWSATRNLSNLLIALPVAALADNVSIDFGTLTPYVMLIPREGYDWRQAVFGQTVGLSYVAGWVNQQSFAPNFLNGYVAAIAAAAAYIIIQLVWSSRSLN